MAVQTGEGTIEIIYGASSIPAGPRTYTGYLARPDASGEWPTVVVFGDEPKPSSAVKHHCRMLARHGIAAIAPDFTLDPDGNARIARAAGAFIGNPSGEWSSGQFGFGVVSFGVGVAGATAFAASDGRIVAVAVVGGGIDDTSADDLATASVPTLFVGSRGDATIDIDASVAHKDRLATATFVIYPSAPSGFWSDDADEFSEEVYEDVVDRLVGFFSEQLPPRI